METVAKIIGYVLMTLTASALFVSAFAWAISEAKEFLSSIKRDAIVRARKDLGYMIIRESYWMSEDIKSMRLMEILGRSIHCHSDGIFEISKVRDEWREKIRGE